jgi:hypothetical protein
MQIKNLSSLLQGASIAGSTLREAKAAANAVVPSATAGPAGGAAVDAFETYVASPFAAAASVGASSAAASASVSLLADARHEVANFVADEGAADSLPVTGELLATLGGTTIEEADSLFGVMMAYQKLAQKESREDRQLARSSPSLELQSKAGKLGLESSKIDAGKKEAAERFDQAMQAATSELVLGLVGSARHATSAIGRAVAELEGAAAGHLQDFAPSDSRGLEKAANRVQIAVEKLETMAEEADASRKAEESSDPRRREAMEALQKFLDMLRSIDPDI